ncbi:hypothetical protein JL475_31855 [Streptomyces sp. M2CJ-2]|uniref:hypothetical protein n=1 Tax=Streptomyces sp. M2CJ-2 TaxID=2803948 RepID=UPI0019283EEF|nr:hypothetical protein [Streptomyces sp. M2CJ-2]MBL3670492.1 hypothetical protein [Streptomyces sp. M2CJ-2]
MRSNQGVQGSRFQTLTELAHRGVTLSPATVAGTIEQQITAVSEWLGIQVRSAWRYFDAKATADRLAQRAWPPYEESSSEKSVGQASMPPLNEDPPS